MFQRLVLVREGWKKTGLFKQSYHIDFKTDYVSLCHRLLRNDSFGADEVAAVVTAIGELLKVHAFAAR